MPKAPAARRAANHAKKFTQGNNKLWDMTLHGSVDAVVHRAALMSPAPGAVLAWFEDNYEKASKLVFSPPSGIGNTRAAASYPDRPGRQNVDLTGKQEFLDSESMSVVSPTKPLADRIAGQSMMVGRDRTFVDIYTHLERVRVDDPPRFERMERWWRRRVNGIVDEEDE